MAFHKIILSQVLDEVNKYDFKKQVSKFDGDKKTSKLTCFGILVTMIFSQFKKIHSLRGLVLSLGLMASSFYHLNLKSIKRSTLSDAFASRSSEIYENYFYELLKNLNRKQKRYINKKLHLIDATTISLCLEKYKWARFRKTKAGIKLHTMIDGNTLIPEQVIITNANVHDIKGIKSKIRFNKGEIYVYDRGYCSYKYLYSIEEAESFFVTRLKSNWKIEIVEELDADEENNVLADAIIRVAGTKANDYPDKLRVITFYHEESKKEFRFLTNNFEIDSKVIAEIYKQRWQIELFFKWIKQHLKIKSFLSTTKNGVKIQVWCSLITYVLLALIKSRIVKPLKMFDIFRRISESLDRREDLLELLTKKITGHLQPLISKHYGQLELNYA